MTKQARKGFDLDLFLARVGSKWYRVVKRGEATEPERNRIARTKTALRTSFPTIACRGEGETREWKTAGGTSRAAAKAHTHQLFGFSGESSASTVHESRQNRRPDRLRLFRLWTFFWLPPHCHRIATPHPKRHSDPRHPHCPCRCLPELVVSMTINFRK
jgi:hypothetical protein